LGCRAKGRMKADNPCLRAVDTVVGDRRQTESFKDFIEATHASTGDNLHPPI
jgi:hypothetical protein